jgi:hypothetical protein
LVGFQSLWLGFLTFYLNICGHTVWINLICYAGGKFSENSFVFQSQRKIPGFFEISTGIFSKVQI